MLLRFAFKNILGETVFLGGITTREWREKSVCWGELFPSIVLIVTSFEIRTSNVKCRFGPDVFAPLC